MAFASSQGLKGKPMMEQAAFVGAKIAKEAAAKGVRKVVFDRGGFTYTGVIRALADAARKNGLAF